MACSLLVRGEFLPQVEELKYLGILFTSEGRMECETDRQLGAAAAVMLSLYRSVMVKRFSGQSTFLPLPKEKDPGYTRPK